MSRIAFLTGWRAVAWWACGGLILLGHAGGPCPAQVFPAAACAHFHRRRCEGGIRPLARRRHDRSHRQGSGKGSEDVEIEMIDESG